MTHISDIFAAPRRLSLSARIAALAVLAGLSYGATVAAPAAAGSRGWRSASGSIQYDACMHLQSCQTMANKAGHEIFGMGCFGIKPDNLPEPVTKR